MRVTLIACAGGLAALAANPASAAVPPSIVAALSPSIGYMLAQSDLCGWNLTAKIRTTYEADLRKTGLTAAQRTQVWAQAAARQKELAGLPDQATAGMKANTCTPAFRTKLEHDLAD